MKRITTCLVPWMVVVASASAQTRVAQVSYTYHGLVTSSSYRLGQECFVPMDELPVLGWTANQDGDRIVIDAEGRRLSLVSRTIAGKTCLPLRQAIDQLGMSANWATGTDRLDVFSEAKELRFRDGQFEGKFPGFVRPKAYALSAPNRIVVDIEGAHLTSQTRLDLDADTRAVQVKPGLIRITTEIDFRAYPPVGTIIPTDRPQFAFSTNAPTSSSIAEEEPNEMTDVPTDVTLPVDPGMFSGPMGTLRLSVDIEGPSATLLSIRTNGAIVGASVYKPSPTTLEVTLPGVKMELPDDFALNTDSVVASRTRHTANSTVLVLELPRAMGVEVWSDANGVQIQLLKPDVGNGRLAGKVIVVDPGHGGRDIGCHAAGINEKDLTLAIGRLVSAELSAQGATVIMTRRSDVFIPLPERCDIANRNKADFFISCHINSSRRQTFSGSIIFHHEGRPMSQLLAECVMSEVGKVSKLPARGAWSDRKIYQSGFAVLRNTKMPGVLCEFGFINQPTDRARMVTAGFQRAVAAAVMRGIKVYLGNAKGQ